MPGTWNPSDKLNITLSGGDLVASGGTATGGVRSTFAATTGKWYWEFTVNAWGNNGSTGVGVGNVNAIFTNATPLNVAVVYKTGAVWVNNVNSGISLGASVDGGLICVALDLGAGRIWFRRGAAGSWNASSGTTNDPATGVGGINVSAIFGPTLATFAFVYSVIGTAVQVTANFGGSAFAGTPSSGYGSGLGSGTTAPNSWSAIDKTSNVALTGGNLIGTATGSPQGGARAVYGQSTGKYYWEVTCNVITGLAGGNCTAVGATIAGFGLTQPPGLTSIPGIVSLTKAGLVHTSAGDAAGVAFGTITNGTLVCIAYDVGANQVWFRLGAAGNWNANAANNPATGVGGVSPPGMGAGVAVFPTMWTQATSDQITGNFGVAAFTGSAPAGFTSGFSGDPPVVPTFRNPIAYVVS